MVEWVMQTVDSDFLFALKCQRAYSAMFEIIHSYYVFLMKNPQLLQPRDAKRGIFA